MRVVNMHEAKTNLSRLVQAASEGEPFIIARAGKPLVKVLAHNAPNPATMRRVGFLENLSVPNDFDTMMQDEIRALFEEGA